MRTIIAAGGVAFWIASVPVCAEAGNRSTLEELLRKPPAPASSVIYECFSEHLIEGERIEPTEPPPERLEPPSNFTEALQSDL